MSLTRPQPSPRLQRAPQGAVSSEARSVHLLGKGDSDQVHLKALELLLFGFPEKVKLLDHFFQSYNKNYSFNIFGIPEVDEPSTSEYYDPRMQNGTMLTKAGQRRFNEEMKKQLLSQSESPVMSGKKRSRHVSIANDINDENYTPTGGTRTVLSSKRDPAGKNSNKLTPNRKKHFLKSREGERNFEVIPSSERISESNNAVTDLAKDEKARFGQRGIKGEKRRGLKPEFRIERDVREEAHQRGLKTKLRGDAVHKGHEKNPRGAPFTRKSGDFRGIRKTYEKLNENPQEEPGRKVTKNVRTGLSSEHYTKWDINRRKKHSFGGRGAPNQIDKGSKNGFKSFKVKEQETPKYDESYQKQSTRSIENNIKSKKKKFYSIDK